MELAGVLKRDTKIIQKRKINWTLSNFSGKEKTVKK